jgi:hypothetical protein
MRTGSMGFPTICNGKSGCQLFSGRKKNWSFVSTIVVVPSADPIDLDLLEVKEATS